ncbi:reverse transcriptase-like protein [Elysia marginata]|uniref:Reverse transcriptase-like protein n=1 Tax=Elysia marginata TaxID=1093978 RepID=A0AAV4EHL6_9GAST|nr:reverse transcriptase-like protein [Elysia marginata]
MMDNSFAMNDGISEIRRSCCLELRKIADIRSYLSVEATNKLVCAFVTSKLDYCNSLVTGISESEIAKLQQVQNNAAKLVYGKKRSGRATPLLKELHWLPVRQRIECGAASIVFQCLSLPNCPTCLSAVFAPYTPTRTLGSEGRNLLAKPGAGLETCGDRAFAFRGPDVWNRLPLSVQQSEPLSGFESVLKTCLFKN